MPTRARSAASCRGWAVWAPEAGRSSLAYLFEHSWEHERERLAAIERGDASTLECLSPIGVAEGWRCLEVGAGAGSIARWLCARVGPWGRRPA